MLDISWATIGKIIISGLATFVILPAALVLRDYVLWKLINAYILNAKLREEVRRYAVLVNLWNSKYAGESQLHVSGGKATHTINGAEVSPEQWARHSEEMDNVEKNMEEAGLFVRRMSNFLNWLLKHYKQDATNPIDDWFRKDIEKLKRDAEKKGS